MQEAFVGDRPVNDENGHVKVTLADVDVVIEKKDDKLNTSEWRVLDVQDTS